MKVVIYEHRDAQRYRALHALAEGIPGAVVRDILDWQPCDVAVMFGLEKYKFPVTKAKGEIIRKARECNAGVLIVEQGYIKRTDFRAVGWNGINGHADFRNDGMPPDRWQKLNVTLAPWHQKSGGYVLVCGQVPWDVSVQDGNHLAWCRETVDEAKRRGFKVRFRPHPYAVKRNVVHDVACDISAATLADDLASARCVVTYNSNTGVDAILAGVPVIAFDDGSMVRTIAGRSLDDLGNPPTPDRTQWAYDIAYAQWTMDELANGAAWAHIGR